MMPYTEVTPVEKIATLGRFLSLSEIVLKTRDSHGWIHARSSRIGYQVNEHSVAFASSQRRLVTSAACGFHTILFISIN